MELLFHIYSIPKIWGIYLDFEISWLVLWIELSIYHPWFKGFKHHGTKVFDNKTCDIVNIVDKWWLVCGWLVITPVSNPMYGEYKKSDPQSGFAALAVISGMLWIDIIDGTVSKVWNGNPSDESIQLSVLLVLGVVVALTWFYIGSTLLWCI